MGVLVVICLGRVPLFGIFIYFILRPDNDKKVKRVLGDGTMDAPDTNRTKKIKVEIKEDRKEGKRVKLDEGMKDLKQVQNITVFVSKDNSVRDSSYFNYYKKIIESRL